MALGSNLDNPQQKIKMLFTINEIDDVILLQLQALYETPPVGFLNQPNFINAVSQNFFINKFNELLLKLFDIEHNSEELEKKRMAQEH